MMPRSREVYITEVALQGGIIAHQFSVDQVLQVAKDLDEANVPYIEVAHGDELVQYNLAPISQFELIEAVVSVCKRAKIAIRLLPGARTVKELRQAGSLGAKVARIATHVMEADSSAQYIHSAKDLGMEAVGFLMMAHIASVPELIEQAKQMESYGADTIYVVDSAGALLIHEVKERIHALSQYVGVNIGFHGRNNLSLAVANTIAAIEEGATCIDGSVRCLGKGAVSTQTEVLVAVLERLNISSGIDLYKMMDIAEDIVGPILSIPQQITRNSVILG